LSPHASALVSINSTISPAELFPQSRQSIFPMGVVGILSINTTFFGYSRPAMRSLQKEPRF